MKQTIHTRLAFKSLLISAGTALMLGAASNAARAQTENVLYTFSGQADGGSPWGTVARDKHGNLYGATEFGGAGYGVVFRVAPPYGQNSQTVLYTFSGGSDGGYPVGGLVVDKKGNVYGTTHYGGDGAAPGGHGVIFRLAPPYGQNKQTILYTFSGAADGAYPYASLITDKKGNLYGTTEFGGPANGGVVFELSPPYGAAHYQSLFSFSGGDGSVLMGGVVMDKKHNLYGATTLGGSGSGVVFKLAPPYGAGNETVLYTFTGGSDGGFPDAGVIVDKKGNVYGTTTQGGSASFGVVYKVSPPYGQSSEKVLYTFTGGADGGYPECLLVRDKAGNLYGTTAISGNGAGVVFKLAPPYGQQSEVVLCTFNGPNGESPRSGLIMDRSGILYGATPGGGPSGNGVVFQITP